MNSSLQYELKDGYLLIIGEGQRVNFSEILAGTKYLHQLIKKFNSDLVLIDYRKVFYNIPMTDAFNLIRTYELEMPDFKKISMAAVVNKESKEISQFWKSVGRKRDFNFEVFEEIEIAEQWLLLQDSK